MTEFIYSENHSTKHANSAKKSDFLKKDSKLSKSPSLNNALLRKTRYFYESLDVDSLEEVANVHYFMKREFDEATGELNYI